jgi:NADP-dependent aldehyde dehydrogenase
MNINGEMLLGNKVVKGSCSEIYAINPATGEKIAPAFFGAKKADVNVACELAQGAFDAYRNISLELRATFIETIADEILALGDTLIQRAMAESGLPQMRIEGERGRTMGQLKLFASVVRSGNWIDARIDPAMPERTPLPRADLRLRHIPLGPVAVFGASNFPLAFSVAGGDTASALAAGCPVIVKAHSAHPGTSELVGKAIISAANKCQIPEGVFSLIFASGTEVGAELVAHPAIKAVGFTGSRSGGLALMNIAANRPEPIPVYAEMSSINPVFLLPNSLAKNAKSLASGFVSSLTLGAGQFCTNPGLVIGLVSDQLNEFIQQAQTELTDSPAQTMLTPGIHKTYLAGIKQLTDSDEVADLASGQGSTEPNRCQAKIFQTTAQQFISAPSLADEVFGSTSLLVTCQSTEEMLLVAEHLEGQLTATMQLNDDDINVARQLLTILERKAGRVLCNGYPTGVEVCHSMVHGGPFPATSDSRSTSVGSAAILRFLRPVSYQDMPTELLPEELKDDNSLALNRLIDGIYEK